MTEAQRKKPTYEMFVVEKIDRPDGTTQVLGKVFNHPRHENGTLIRSSPLVDIRTVEGLRVFESVDSFYLERKCL